MQEVRRKCVRCSRVGYVVRSNGLCIGNCADEYNAIQASVYLSARAGGQCTECGAAAKRARCWECNERRNRNRRGWRPA